MTLKIDLWDFEALRYALLDTRDAADFAALCVEAVEEWTGGYPDFHHAIRLNAEGQVEIDHDSGVIILDPYAADPIQVHSYRVAMEWQTQSAALVPATDSRCVFAPADPVSEGLLRGCIIERLRVLWAFATECCT